jgi:nicotinate dehydrogenase subunit A
MATYSLRINGVTKSAEADDPNKPLLYVLRGLGLTATKFGCGLGQCGTCTVIVDGQPVRSCLMPISTASGKSITTLEGLGSVTNPHPIQKAFIEHQVPQCGYCTSGIIMSTAALLEKNKQPTEAEIRSALDGNLCRCGTHTRVIAAIVALASQRQGA